VVGDLELCQDILEGESFDSGREPSHITAVWVNTDVEGGSWSTITVFRTVMMQKYIL